MKTIKSTFTLLTLLTALFLTQSCKSKNPSVAKIFVRSSSNELLSGAKVVIIAEVDKNESNIEYVDTLITNSSGYVQFDLENYFSEAGSDIKVAEFLAVCRKSPAEGFGTIRTRINTTAVETVYIVE